MIRITSKVNGFRRAGLAHPAGPTDYPDDAFTQEQLAELLAEPMLLVSHKPDAVSGQNDEQLSAGAEVAEADAKAAAESQQGADSSPAGDAAAPAAKPATAAKGSARKAGAQ